VLVYIHNSFGNTHMQIVNRKVVC